MTITATDHTNAIRARAGFDALCRGDLATLMSMFRPDANWHVTGGPMAGTLTGADAIEAVLTQIVELTGGSLRIEILGLSATSDLTVSLLHETATRVDDGRELDARTVLVHRLDGDGKVVEFWELPIDSAAYSAFFE